MASKEVASVVMGRSFQQDDERRSGASEDSAARGNPILRRARSFRKPELRASDSLVAGRAVSYRWKREISVQPARVNSAAGRPLVGELGPHNRGGPRAGDFGRPRACRQCAARATAVVPRDSSLRAGGCTSILRRYGGGDLLARARQVFERLGHRLLTLLGLLVVQHVAAGRPQ